MLRFSQIYELSEEEEEEEDEEEDEEEADEGEDDDVKKELFATPKRIRT